MKKTNLIKPNKRNRYTKLLCVMIFILVCLQTVAFADPGAGGGNPITVVNNLSDFVFTIVRAVGVIMMCMALVGIGMSFKSHDPSQRAQSFLGLAGGLIIMFAKEILNLIGAGI